MGTKAKRSVPVAQSPIQQALAGTRLRIQCLADSNWSYGWLNSNSGEYTGKDGFRSEVEALTAALKSLETKIVWF